MRKLLLISGLALIICGWEPYKPEPFPYRPILMTRQVLESSVAYMPPRIIEKPGKIYTIGKYIYVNEKYNGIHVIDNTDPSNPVNAGFVRIPGCIDMALKGTILYADNAVDLVAVDLTDLENLHVTSRVKNAFPELLPPGESYIPWEYNAENRPENTIIIGWE